MNYYEILHKSNLCIITTQNASTSATLTLGKSCRVLDEEEHVAVLFYEEKKRDSMKALQHLEMIDDEADLFGIR